MNSSEVFRILPLDVIVFIVFVITVVAVGLIKSKTDESSEDYFLAGRGLRWWLIGFSLIAANISTEQFVGMSGNAASHVGLAIASYEWMAAITLVVVAFRVPALLPPGGHLHDARVPRVPLQRARPARSWRSRPS